MSIKAKCVPKLKPESTASPPFLPPSPRNQPLLHGSTSNLGLHRHPPTHRVVQDNSESVLDYYKTIQLPSPSAPSCSASSQASSFLKNLTHPSELRKRGGRNCSNQNEMVKGGEGNEVRFTKRKKRKFEDYPNVFDHLAMLHRKQQKYLEERYTCSIVQGLVKGTKPMRARSCCSNYTS